MKRSRTVYEGGESREEEGEIVVSSVVLCSLISFLSNEDFIQSCDQSLVRSVFDGDFEWFVGWMPDKAESDLRRPGLFNTTFFMGALRTTLVSARLYVRGMGGFAMWAVEDIWRWLHLYVNARSDVERRAIGLPFGVMDAWEYSLRGKRALGRHYEFTVVPHRKVPGVRYMYYNYETTLIPVNSRDLEACRRRVDFAYLGAIHRDIINADSGITADRLFMPKTPFLQLNQMAEDLFATHTNLFDADWLRAHPQFIVRAGQPKPINPNDISDTDMYTSGTRTEAALREPRRQRKESTQDVINMITSIQRSMGLFSGGAKKSTRHKQRDFYRRPDMLEDAAVFYDEVEKIHWDPPDVLDDYEKRNEEYMNRVTVVMGIGENSRLYQAVTGKLRSENRGVAGKSQISMMAEQRQQQMTVRQEQTIYQRLFDVMYEFAGFSDRDALALSETIGYLDTYIAQHEAALTTGTFNSPEEAALNLFEVTEEEKATKREKLKPWRATLGRVKKWYERLTVDPDYRLASLVFQNKDDEANALQFMLDMSDRMMLKDVKDLEKQAEIVFNKSIKLQKPPLPEEGGPPPPKKKQKKSD